METEFMAMALNVAARIEGLAEPGGVSVSRNAYGQIKDKLTFGYEDLGQHEEAIAEGKRSVELQPNGAMIHGLLGFIPVVIYMFRIIFTDEKSLTLYKQALLRSSEAYTIHMSLAITYALLDRQKEADAAVKKVLELYPSFSIERFSTTLPNKNQVDLKFLVGAMRKAGLPE